MPHTTIDELLKLSHAERACIAALLVESLANEGMPQGPDDIELARRVDEYRKNSALAVDWDEARKQLGWE